MQRPSLTQIANELDSDKGTEFGERHNYTSTYDEIFSSLRDEPIRLFEIGIDQGRSLELWSRYFTKAEIFAMDVLDRSNLVRERIKIFQGDQAKREDLLRVMKEAGGTFDVIIDDGGHYMEQQQVSLGTLFPFLKPGGLYVIEDLHTSLAPPGHPLYHGKPLDVRADRRNSTLIMLTILQNSRNVVSEYLTPEEIENLRSQVASCQLHGVKLAVIRKK